MVGLDQFITKNATLSDEKADDAHTIKAMKFSVSPVVRVAVETKVSYYTTTSCNPCDFCSVGCMYCIRRLSAVRVLHEIPTSWPS